MNRLTAHVAGAALGLAVDRVLGDPARYHPVAGMGALAAAVERRFYADSRLAGAGYTAVLVGGAVAVGSAAAGSGAVRVLTTAAATWVALGGTTLARVGDELAAAAQGGDLAAARAVVPSLCGRDPELLDLPGTVRAGVESVAENTSDAAVAPLVWAVACGPAGALGYRMANTLDSMVGYRNTRHGRFGWASARLDDVVNWLPARLCAALTCVVGGRPREAARAWRRDAGRHPSPNAGPVEAAFAGSLGVRLGGLTVYRHGAEQRPTLGDGPPPTAADLRRATRLSRRVQAATVAVAAGGLIAAGALRRQRP